MPKERIFSPHPVEGSPGFQVEVGWMKDMDVQVGITTHDHSSLLDHLYRSHLSQVGNHLESILAKHGRGITDDGYDENNPNHQIVFNEEFLGAAVLAAVRASGDMDYDSLWWHPSRKQINDLMRLLRKARDSAYGKDE